ncbi:MAG: hypothetical protein B6230_08080 [Desulfobacteraceae bacterium 4572_89]|nr:MAG: hypothetical protein B6230_08080 [Desulfobacteraceae bacterium 4572_89]
MKAIQSSGQRIDIITSEIQDAIMNTRMEPMGSLFDKITPIMENLGKKYGKPINFTTRGRNVELDKTILEAMVEPLRLLFETAVTKGIEDPDIRREKDKPLEGHIQVNASHDTGQVNLTLSDDGCGLFPENLAQSAIWAIEGLGGVMDVESIPGQGTKFQIKLPLTQAIIPSQITSLGGERYVIPQSNLGELLRIPAAEVKHKIEKVGDADVIRLRGEILPLLNLPEMLGIKRTFINPETGSPEPEKRKNIADRRALKHKPDGDLSSGEDREEKHNWKERDKTDRRRHHSSAVNIAVVYAGSYKYGLVVEQFQDAEEIVVKPLGRHLNQYKAYAGATIMGDGKAALILDILNLAQMAGLSTLAESSQQENALPENSGPGDDKRSIVMFKNQETEYFAAPFENVQRIERLSTSDIEQIGGQKVIQYRGGALPIYELSQLLDVKALPERKHHEVIVFKVKDREFGLLTTPPVDTLKEILTIDHSTLKQKGIKGSAVIKGHTTLLVDIIEMAGQFIEGDA